MFILITHIIKNSNCTVIHNVNKFKTLKVKYLYMGLSIGIKSNIQKKDVQIIVLLRFVI